MNQNNKMKVLYVAAFMLFCNTCSVYSKIIVHWDFSNPAQNGYYWSEDGTYGISEIPISSNPQGHIVNWASGNPMNLGTSFTIETTAMAYYVNLLSFAPRDYEFNIYARSDDYVANFNVLIGGGEYAFSSGELSISEIFHFAMVKDE